MDLNPFRPRDEAGIPIRFRGHGDAFLWVAGSLVKMYGRRVVIGSAYAIVAWLAWSVVKPVFSGLAFESFPPGWIYAFAFAAAFLLLIWLILSVVVYVYFVLAGGVMNRDEP